MNLRVIFLSLFLFSTAVHANEVTAQDFAHWWEDYRESLDVPAELKKMEDYFVSSELLNRCSKFWLFLNKMNIEQICQKGYCNFKQTVACNYFTWVVNQTHGYGKNLYAQDKSFLRTIPKTELSKKHAFFTQEQSRHYNRTTALLYHYLMQNGAGPHLDVLEEPFFGNPPSIEIHGKSISQDVLNSLMEYLCIANHCDPLTISTVLELGAGSGRTAYCFLKLRPNIKYIIADIPPALFLSQSYLSDVFSTRKIFTFRPFERFEDIQEEFVSSDIVFMTPDQISKLPNQSVDLFIAIDCLHEMKWDEVQSYFNEATRLASLFYFKCWNSTVVPFDNIFYDIHSYPIPTSWQKIFKESCFVPSDFFHAFYKIHHPNTSKSL
jgi:putative sugar O-methyltransferase